MRRTHACLLALVVACLAAIVPAIAMASGASGGTPVAPGETILAQSPEDPGFTGVLENEAGPIPGVEIIVREVGGEEVGRAVSDEEGRWAVTGLAIGTQYEVELVVESLPPEVSLTGESNTRTLLLAIPVTNVLFGFGEGVTGFSAWERLAQNLVTGLKSGLIIAMAAVGLSLIFGTTGLINFAHGEMVAFGAIVAYFFNVTLGWGLILSFVLAVVAGAALGGLLEGVFFSRLRGRRIAGFQFLVITIGLSLMGQALLRLFFGNGFAQYRIPPQHAIRLGPVTTNLRDLIVIGLSILVLVGVGLVLQLTRMGKAMRAVSDNRDLSESSGINVSRVILNVWIMGGALAALGGIFHSATVNIHYLNGFRLLLLMFAAIILGGLGSAYGAMVGGILIGIAMEVSSTWFSSEVKQVWALIILIVVLLVRPQGILGRAERLG